MFEKKITDEEKKKIEKEARKAKKLKEKELKKKQKSNKMSLKTIILPLVAAAIVVCLIYILVQKQEDSKIIETTMVVTVDEIPANTYVESDEINLFFTVVEIDATKVPENIYHSISELPEDGFYVENELVSKQPIYFDDISEYDAIMVKYVEGTTTTSIAVDAFDNSVSGTVRRGDIVSIFAKNPASDELELQIENVYVVAAYDSSGEEITGEGVATVFTIMVAPDEKEAVNTAISYEGIQLYLTAE